ncbi:hypothetical protein LSH36_131g05039 [Paralvinella palmiformis]|uniref:DDE-1 domain-containing protein n=1 Tax=Paralvinella palmiformis TaxID=53620 RepID=A0AAD9JWX1_9ANNE|nr:hypothetical protein LSH36_131g05039 [Paralvinella palmiformis]
MSPALEAGFTKKLMDLADRGFGLTKQLVLQKTEKLCRLAQLRHPFKEGPKRENVTVVACASAAGVVMPPMFVVKGKTYKSLHSFNTAEAPPNSKWTWQAKAWMEDSLGIEWFREVFLKYCGVQRPQVLLLDQHHSHEVYEMILLARKENIHLITFPPHTTHWLQPLDKGCFASLSKHYRSVCNGFTATSKFQVTFACLFAEAWERSMTPKNVRAGFPVTGICPFSPDICHLFITRRCLWPSVYRLLPNWMLLVEPIELMVVDSSEVSALPCHLQESGPDKPEAWSWNEEKQK